MGGVEGFWTSLAFIVIATQHYPIISVSLQKCNIVLIVIILEIKGVQGVLGAYEIFHFFCHYKALIG